MSIIKCKMCGGDIALNEEKTFGTCECCGSQMTFPKISDENRLNLFNRGNAFRRAGEFDKALALYENIVREDDTDAEAHWCCALCRFGIEYVEDPTTFEYIPTCHRASFDSFLDDVDYKAAVENADGVTKRQYQKDGVKISDVQKGILATSQNEKPFDVFICYKETDDATGQRTKDSLDAQEIYYQLTNEGYRVFFSRITLEDKVGAEFEPYIFAALNSAKVMIVIGSKPEYFNAVWVKNEWSRFLAIMRKDRSKLLLPCYKNMDPYDLPEQLSILQSYDMTKIGFIQDLIRGIKKVTAVDEPKAVVKETVVVNNNGASANNSALLERAYMFLEDGKWAEADEYCEKVLDAEPKNAEAYLGKLMAELKVKDKNKLKDTAQPFDDKDNCVKATRFDSAIAEKLKADNEFIRERNENTRLTGIYTKAVNSMNSAKTEGEFKAAASLFDSIKGFKDADEKKKECLEKAEIARKDAIYENALSKMNGDNALTYKDAITAFESIIDWKDSRAKIDECNDCIEKIRIAEEKAEEERKRKEKEAEAELKRKAEEVRIAEEKARAKKNRMTVIILSIVTVAVVFLIILNAVILPASNYKKAVAAADAGNYSEAYSLFDKHPNYKDTQAKIKETKFKEATALLEAEKYDEAYILFDELGDKSTINESKLKRAKALLESEKYDEAYKLFGEAGDIEAIEESRLKRASNLLDAKKYDEAYLLIAELENTEIISDKIYDVASEYVNNKNIVKAVAFFTQIPGYKDSDAIVRNLLAETLSIESSRTVALKADGTVVAIGYNENGRCDVSDWTDIVAVSAGGYHTIGLKSDGTVVAVGYSDSGSCDVSEWTDIVSVSAGDRHTVGLEADGTVVAVGNNDYGQCDVSDWTDIVAISAGGWHTIGLKADGTVVATGRNGDGQCDVADWKNIVAVSAGDWLTVGLKADGTVVAVGNNDYGQCDVSDWTDIVAICAGDRHTVGLKADGTVVATKYKGLSEYYSGQCDVSDWKNIVVVTAAVNYTVALKADGTVVAVGENKYGQCDVSDWKNIKVNTCK